MMDNNLNTDNGYEDAEGASGPQRRDEELDHEARRRLEQRLEASWINRQTQDYNYDLD